MATNLMAKLGNPLSFRTLAFRNGLSITFTGVRQRIVITLSKCSINSGDDLSISGKNLVGFCLELQSFLRLNCVHSRHRSAVGLV